MPCAIERACVNMLTKKILQCGSGECKSSSNQIIIMITIIMITVIMTTMVTTTKLMK